MSKSLGRRIFLAHLELSYRLGRKITLAEFGELTAREMGRDAPFTAASVSRWESGVQVPTLPIIEAIGALTGTDPGWISHGSRTAAPGPRTLDESTGLADMRADHRELAIDATRRQRPLDPNARA
jgi:transcriptional regulator with XRE-family HTH domain